MKSKIIIIFFLHYSYLQTVNGQSFPNGFDSAILNSIQKEGEDSFSKKLQCDLKKDPTLFLDKDGNFSNTKFLIYTSKIGLETQIAIFNQFARLTLTLNEYKHYQNLKLNVNENTKWPVLTLGRNVDFDKDWIVSYFIQSMLVLNAKLNKEEYAYYIENSKIEDNPAPDYIVDIISDIRTDQMSKNLANVISQTYFSFFVVMHEFYHSYYDQTNANTIQKELSADSFAIVKCSILFKNDTKIMDSSFRDSIESTLGKGKLKELTEIKNNCGSSSKLFGKDVTITGFFVSQLGNRFIDVLIKKNTNLMLTNPEVTELDLVRTSQFNSVSKELLHCNTDPDNIFCCLTLNEADNTNFLKESLLKLKSPIYYRNLEINKDTFIYLNPENPSFISFQLGNYYLHLGDYKKAIQYFSSANLFEIPTSTTIICNLLIGDLYKYKPSEKNIDKATLFYQKAKELNKRIPTFREKIINKD